MPFRLRALSAALVLLAAAAHPGAAAENDRSRPGGLDDGGALDKGPAVPATVAAALPPLPLIPGLAPAMPPILREEPEGSAAAKDAKKPSTPVSPAWKALQEELRSASRRLVACRKAGDVPCAAETEALIGTVFERLGDPSGARYRFGRALRLTDGVEAPRALALAHFGLGRIAPTPQRALDELNLAVANARQVRDPKLVAGIQTERAAQLIRLGRGAEAFGPLHDAVRISERAREPSTRIAALGALARAKASLGRTTEALTELGRALGAASASGFEAERSALLADVAEIQLDLGRVGAAEGTAAEAIGVAERAGLAGRVTELRSFRARALLEKGELVAAEEEIVRARSARRGAGDLRGEAEVLVDAGLAELTLGRYSSSAVRLAEASQIFTAIGAPEEEGELDAKFLSLRASFAERAGDSMRAERDLRRAVGIAYAGGDLDLAARLRGRLAAVYRRFGRNGDSAAELRKSLDDLRKARSHTGIWWFWSELGESWRLAGFSQQAGAAFDSSLVELQRPASNVRSRRLRELFPWDASVAAVRAVSFRADAGDLEGAFEAAEIGAARELRDLAAAADARSGWELPAGRDLGRTLRGAIPEGTVLAEVVLADPVSFLFLVDRDGMTMTRLEPEARLGPVIDAAFALVSTPAPLARSRRALEDLARRILPPWFASAPRRDGRVVFVLPPRLGRFPMELLWVPGPDGRPGLFLEHTTVTYAPSAAAWMKLRQTPRSGGAREAGAAALSLGLRGQEPQPALAREAARALRRLAATRLLLEGGGATVAAYGAIPERLSLLHFALPVRYGAEPDDAALLLEDRPLAIGAATARPVETDLTSIALVGGGLRADPDGRASRAVAIAFLSSGSRAVLVPTWAVDERQAARFFADLHSGIANGLSAEQAVTMSQRRGWSRGGWEHPASWASFRVVGDGGAWIRARRRFPWGAILTAALATIAIFVFALRRRFRHAGVVPHTGPQWLRRLLGAPKMPERPIP